MSIILRHILMLYQFASKDIFYEANLMVYDLHYLIKSDKDSCRGVGSNRSLIYKQIMQILRPAPSKRPATQNRHLFVPGDVMGLPDCL